MKAKDQFFLNEKLLLEEIETRKKLKNQVLESLNSPLNGEEEALKMKNEDTNKQKAVLCLKEVWNEIIDWIESSNFQVLYYHYIRFNFFKLKTRLLLDENKNKNEKLKFAHYLTRIYRITEEEFLSANSQENNEAFYKNRIKLCLSKVSNNENTSDFKELSLNLRILQEYELSLVLEESLDEILRRIYLEEMFEDRVIEPPTDDKQLEGKEFNEMMTILQQFG